jgi:hypothetical protein
MDATANSTKTEKTKKDQLLALYAAGITDVGDLSLITNTRASYVAGVLQEAEKEIDYFDLYTSTKQPMNVYSKFFAGKLGFKDVPTARKSVELIDHYYRQFMLAEDRAGQHHALHMALTMFDRARWTNKLSEADIFRAWLIEKLQEPEPEIDQPVSPPMPVPRRPSKRMPNKPR